MNFCNKVHSAMLGVAFASILGACDSAPEDSQNGATPPLPDSVGRSGDITVSGISSGAYMAVQTHVALADRIAGVGAVAGGPYHCASGNVLTALGECLNGEGLDANALIEFAADKQSQAEIGSKSALADSRAWIFHGASDIVVAKSVSDALVEFYQAFLPPPNLRYVTDIDAAHGWPTIDQGSACNLIDGAFVNSCNYDAAGELLQFLYGELSLATDEQTGTLVETDFSSYFETDSGVDSQGFLYVPPDCRQDSRQCRLHIAFHGCRQGTEFVGDRFVQASGLNEWADANHIVVAYPQIASRRNNPQGCWDWWGYTGPNYDLASGDQISGVAAVIDAFENGDLTGADASDATLTPSSESDSKSE